MKTAISLPDGVFAAAERLSRKKGMSRSEFYATAIRFFVEKESKHSITEQLNKVYNSESQDEILAGLEDLPVENWK